MGLTRTASFLRSSTPKFSSRRHSSTPLTPRAVGNPSSSRRERSGSLSEAEEAKLEAELELLKQNASLKAEAEALRAQVGALKTVLRSWGPQEAGSPEEEVWSPASSQEP